MTSWFDRFEKDILNAFTRLGPWLAPIGPAFFIGQAAAKHLSIPPLVAITIAISVECVNIASAHLAIRLFSWNRVQPDHAGPFGLALALVGMCLLTSITLAVLLEAFPFLVSVALVLLFLLAGVAYTVLALSREQVRREAAASKATETETQLARFYSATRGMGVKRSGANAALLAAEGDVIAALAALERQYLPENERQFAAVTETLPQNDRQVMTAAPVLPAWLPERPRDRAHFRQMIRSGTVRIPEDLTGAELATIIGKSARTGHYWLNEAKTLNGRHQEKTDVKE